METDFEMETDQEEDNFNFYSIVGSERVINSIEEMTKQHPNYDMFDPAFIKKCTNHLFQKNQYQYADHYINRFCPFGRMKVRYFGEIMEMFHDELSVICQNFLKNSVQQ
jgi:hypothetical protein